jgi:hypothetical protein
MKLHEITGRVPYGRHDIVWFRPVDLVNQEAIAARWTAWRAAYPGCRPKHVLLENEDKDPATGKYIYPLSAMQADVPTVARSFRYWRDTVAMVHAQLGDVLVAISDLPSPYLTGMYQAIQPGNRWGYTAPMAAANAAQVRLVEEFSSYNDPLIDWVCPSLYTQTDDPTETLEMARYTLAEAERFGVPIIPAIMPQLNLPDKDQAKAFAWLSVEAWNILLAEASRYTRAILYITRRAEREPWPLLDSMRGRFGIEAGE